MIAATTARLLAVAREAFAAEGFGAVSLDELAARAGMTRGAIHHHFGNKAGLFEAVLRQLEAEIGVELDRVAAEFKDPWEGFRRCAHVYLDLAVAPGRRRILFQDAPAVLGGRAYEILVDSGLSDIVESLRGMIEAGRIAAPDPVALAHVLNGAVVNLAFWVAEEADGRAAAAHATLDRLFLGFTPAHPGG